VKISSNFVTHIKAPSAVLGRDITEPGVYREADDLAGDQARLIVLPDGSKLLMCPAGDSGCTLRTAEVSLGWLWRPVKEKITITFDTTQD